MTKIKNCERGIDSPMNAKAKINPCGGIATVSRSKPCSKCGSLHCFPVVAKEQSHD